MVRSLKETGYYENTIIVFTSDNGGAVKVGGSNLPLRGTKGTLYEGGTRAIGFIHSPLLKTAGSTYTNLMHAVDWLPTLLSAIGQGSMPTSGLNGVNHWEALNNKNKPAPRDEIVYNVKEKPFMAAIRVGDYKMIWGSRTQRDTWYKVREEIINTMHCDQVRRTRIHANNTINSSITRDRNAMDVFPLIDDVDKEPEDNALALMQKRMAKEEGVDHNTEQNKGLNKMEGFAAPLIPENQKGIARKPREDRRKERKNKESKKKGNKKKKGGSGKNKKNKQLLNNYGVVIKPWGPKMLFNIQEDPEEKLDISADNPGVVEQLTKRINEHFLNLQPQFTPEDDENGNPVRWGGNWSPGWCDLHIIQD